ncbi:hypothetical protein CLCR_10317 [Cladophialophora carrionii]|uniref:Chalcone isomerase domain-containing protein n=1 Tax=Cladophialophora carrionii TaxID=86049 RepID=A0A1C1CXD5_9EURO|nr:hypothetical protein CLCR_10317 [Cladophialophora carrionii]
MKTSPLRMLVSRRVCTCNLSQLQAGHAPSSPHLIRLLSSSTKHNAQASFTSPVPGYGSSEMLRRKYQKSEPSELEKEKAERASTVKRMRYSGYGIAACTVAIFATIALYPSASAEQIIKQDAPPPPTPSTVLDETSAKEVEQVPTGTSTIPFFPRIIHLTSDAPPSTPGAANEGKTDEEYQLVGLGIRTVSMFSIQVYVVGLYIAVSDIAALQQRLINAVVPPSQSVATTLVPGEKDQLRQLLLDPTRGEDIWNEILKDGHLRMAFRIVPTRNTDFMHLRDGFVRGITARSAHFASDRNDSSFQDETFGAALNDFKSAFGGSARRKLPKGEILLLVRDGQGKMSVWEETSKTGDRVKMGDISDERVGRLLWLGYLAGKNVSSEPARQNVVEGCMEFVERPVGTVATQVV